MSRVGPWVELRVVRDADPIEPHVLQALEHAASVHGITEVTPKILAGPPSRVRRRWAGVSGAGS